MEKEWVAKAAEGGIGSEDLLAAGDGPSDNGARSSPSWRGLVIAVIAAIVLSVSATLLLGGSFGAYGLYGRSAAGGCGAAGNCCPLPVENR